MSSEREQPLRVLIAGGGVAGLEAALALRDLAGERVAMMMLAPGSDFVYRPMRVREPFAYSVAQRYPLEHMAREIGAELRRDKFKWLDSAARVVHTEEGVELSYDALILALGASLRPRFKHAVTLDDRRLDEQLHGLVQDVEGGYVRRLVFLIPQPTPWPLPAYELALMTARRAFDMSADVSISVVTPEDAPLAIFGSAASDAVQRLLAENRIETITSAHAETPAAGKVEIHPGPRRLNADRVVALPELFGPPARGVPKGSENGFIPIDDRCQVRGLDRVYAAGDATDFPIKHGGIAAQQADTAAGAIAALAGAPVQPSKFHPVLHAILLGGDRPLYLSAHVTGGHGSSSEVSDTPTWSPPTKIAARYLGPFLESGDRAALR